MQSEIREIGLRVLQGRPASRAEALSLAEAGRTNPFDVMYWAHRVRRDRFGDSVRLCSIVAGKFGACSEDCKWCAQSVRWPAGRGAADEPDSRQCGAAKASLAQPQEILDAARTAAANQAACIGIVNSGRGPSAADVNRVAESIQQLASDNQCDIRVCASMGVLTDAQAIQLRKAGLARYHHNLETSERFFPRMVSTHSWRERLETLKTARRNGLEVCSGGLFGLGETWEDRIDLAITLRDQIQPESVPLNFLHPIAGTPLENAKPIPPMDILLTISLYRLLLPDADIRMAGGRLANLRDLQSWAFYAGATGCMVGNYLATPGRDVADDLQMLADLGLTVVQEFGQASC